MKNLINDEQSLTSASQHGVPIKIYDDGYGPLWVMRGSMGVQGIVRARTWEDAFAICEDEIFPEADETVEELRKEYNFTRRHTKIIRPADGSPEREAVASDYPLTVAQFVRWDTITEPAEDENGWTENELFQESYGFRNNGPNASDAHKHGIYQKDLNGESLDLLTSQMLEDWSIVLEIKTEE